MSGAAQETHSPVLVRIIHFGPFSEGCWLGGGCTRCRTIWRDIKSTKHLVVPNDFASSGNDYFWKAVLFPCLFFSPHGKNTPEFTMRPHGICDPPSECLCCSCGLGSALAPWLEGRSGRSPEAVHPPPSAPGPATFCGGGGRQRCRDFYQWRKLCSFYTSTEGSCNVSAPPRSLGEGGGGLSVFE